MARRDYFYDPEAPKPNSIRPAAAVALFDSGGNILLLRRKDNDKWTMPGGTLDFGESLTSCAIREVREETGLQIRITGLIGTYSDPNILIAYSDGEVRQEFTFVYAAEIESGELKIDDESKEAAWVPAFIGSRAATGRIATVQAEGRHGVSEGAADVFEVTPSSFRSNSEADSRCTEKGGSRLGTLRNLNSRQGGDTSISARSKRRVGTTSSPSGLFHLNNCELRFPGAKSRCLEARQRYLFKGIHVFSSGHRFPPWVVSGRITSTHTKGVARGNYFECNIRRSSRFDCECRAK